jgi:urate oxidase
MMGGPRQAAQAPGDRIVLGGSRFGKAEVRLVRVDRSKAQFAEPVDLTVTSHLSGELDAVHLDGDNEGVLTTDAQKNTVYAFARDAPIQSAADFGLRLARHFVETVGSVSRAQIEILRHPWERLAAFGVPAPHSFTRAGGPTLVTNVTYEAGRAWVVAGLQDLVVMNATGSEFKGFLKDPYTTLEETDDRILATEVRALWRYPDFEVGEQESSPVDWEKSAAQCQRLLLDAFAATYSKSLQQTLYAMGARALREQPEVVEIRLSMPNKHHYLVDLNRFGRDNPGLVFHAGDRPYGLIEGTVTRADAPPAGPAWSTW